LVTEYVTLADIVMTMYLLHLFKMVLEPAFVKPYGHVVRWFTTCVNQPEFKSVLGEVVLCETMMVAKKETKKEAAAPKAPKEKKEKAPEPAGEDLEAIAAAEQAAPKEKNPLDLLAPTTMVLDEWKRTYSNNDTRPTALNWLWANYDPTGYSMWKV
jgi:elongation factor 1-gamma